MKKLVLSAVVFMIITIFSTTAKSQNYFEVYNHTGITISEVYFYSYLSESWTYNQCYEALNDGNSITARIDTYSSFDCTFNINCVYYYYDDSGIEQKAWFNLSDIDICSYNSISLYMDNEDGSYYFRY
jgi:hypothetical protein